MEEIEVTASGTVIISAARAARVLKENGTLDACRKYMKFQAIRPPVLVRGVGTREELISPLAPD